MRSAVRNFMKLIVICLLGTGAVKATESVTQAEKELAQIEDEYRAARVKADTAYLEKLYGHELRIIGADGSVIERDADIKVFAEGTLKPESIELTDLSIKLYGNVAVVTGRENVKGRYQGKYSEFGLRFTDVFVYRDGRWQLVAAQGTEISE